MHAQTVDYVTHASSGWASPRGPGPGAGVAMASASQASAPPGQEGPPPETRLFPGSGRHRAKLFYEQGAEQPNPPAEIGCKGPHDEELWRHSMSRDPGLNTFIRA